MIFSTFEVAILFGLACFCFVMCFFSRIYLHIQFEDCLRDYVNEQSFLKEARFIVVFEHGCALIGTFLCAFCGHWLSAIFGFVLCMVHVDEWRRGRAVITVNALRTRNATKEAKLYINVKVAVYVAMMVWLGLSLYFSLWQFLDENPAHILNIIKHWSPLRHQMEILQHLASRFRSPI